MKKLIFLLLIIIIVIIIYLRNQDKKIYYLSLGDELSQGYTKYVTDYIKEQGKLELLNNNYYIDNMRTIDLKNMIIENYESEKTIQNALIKADLVTISIGQNDIITKLILSENYDENYIYKFLSDYVNDLDNLLQLIRKYCKEKIIFIGYYNIINKSNVNKYYIYLNKKVEKLLNNYNIIYIDLFSKLNSSKYITENMYPTLDGYKLIGSEIVKYIE